MAFFGPSEYDAVRARWLRFLSTMWSRPWSRPNRPCTTELDNLVDHVAYEVAALEASAERFSKVNLWVYLEVFLLHARLLREFFWGKRRATDVSARDYCDSWREKNQPPTVKATKIPIDKQLAHITKDRVNPKVTMDLGAHVAPLRDELRAAWKRFIGQLASDPRATKFDAALRKKCAELGVPPPP